MAVSGSAIKAGKAYVELYADESALVRGLKAAEKRLTAFGSQVKNIGLAMAAAGASITTPLIAAVAAFVKAGDALEKMSTRSGVAVEALSALGYAAGQNGASLEALGTGLKKMQQALADAASGSATAVKTFDSLGLSVDDLMAMSPDEQFRAIAQAISEIDDPAKRTAAAMDVFGKSGTDLIPLLVQGSKGIKDFEKRARELGVTMSTKDAKAAAALGDAWDDLLSVGGGLTNTIGAALAPALTTIAGHMTAAAVQVSQFVAANREAVLAIAAIGAGLLVGGTAIATFGVAIAAAGAAVGGAATLLAAIVSPIGLAVAGIAAATAALVAGAAAFLYFTESGNKMLTAIEGIASGFAEAWSGMAAAMMSGDLAAAADIAMLQLGISIQEGMLAVRKIVDESVRDMRKSILGAFDDAVKGASELTGVVKLLPGGSGVAEAIDSISGPLGKLSGKASSAAGKQDPQTAAGFKMAEAGIGAAKGLLQSMINKAKTEAAPLVDSPFSQVPNATGRGRAGGLAGGARGFDALKAAAQAEAAARFGGVDPRLNGLAGLGGVIGDVASRKSASAGTFSAAAAARLGGRKGPEQETAQNTKKTADLLGKLLNKKGAAFT